jgi:pimeloyl-ACP methyl ester carboxylesterase
MDAAGMSAGMGAAGSGGGKGMCCSDGNCLCHGDVPAQLTVGKGPYKTAQANISSGTVVYPTDAEPPLAAISICPGFLNTGPEMAAWGPFYASWGIVTVLTNTGAADIPDIRAGLLLDAIEELKKMNTTMSSPLFGKLSGRYGTSGYSMGGGGTTIAAAGTPTLNSSVGLAAWGGNGASNKVPELLLCGDADTVAPCDMSQGVYASIPDSTPKMLVSIPGVTHFDWFGPADAGMGTSGKYALAFQKVFLEGDTRWKSLLMTKPSGGSMTSNLK